MRRAGLAAVASLPADTATAPLQTSPAGNATAQ
jgi:hypothetical protein